MRVNKYASHFLNMKQMKKIMMIAMAAAGLMTGACSGGEQEAVVRGTTSQERLNGQRVFVVPYGSPTIEDSIGVDSVEIQNGKFEFRLRKGTYLARITVDRKVRYGTQDLLVVIEPGEINVVIDSVSSGGGTPQNEALQKWKDLKTAHDGVAWNQSQHIQYLLQQGDTAYANALADSLKQFDAHYDSQIQDILHIMGPGPAYDFLHQRYGN